MSDVLVQSDGIDGCNSIIARDSGCSVGQKQTDEVIWSWCLKETAIWRARGLNFAHVTAEYKNLNAYDPHTFLFLIEDGAVSIIEKPPAPSTPLTDDLNLRAARYRQFFQRVLRPSQAGCRLLLSEDLQEGFTWAGVTVVNPFSSPRHALLNALLEEDTE
ncbi:MAG: hypothetical protein LGL72_12845 [Acidibrevibacterium sp.]|uniref:hypothetical protein n=1 Tax=Acidibrevibacterium fodinaquatile TaxID=1969806 RepID=UPI0023A8ECDA|nr:hypothetical protein [Acidibrevibacterium fodinaquatile]MCA7120267.1 hypothetical protein [Acidibrevibacterium fodinaquatile]